MKTCKPFLLSALVALGCSTKYSSAMIINKVIPPTPTITPATTTSPAVVTCKLDPAADELSYMLFNPSENLGQVGIVLANQLLPPVSQNPILRSDSSTFLPDTAVIDYEVLDGTTSVGRQTSPVTGSVASGATGAVGTIMFPKRSDVAGVAAGTFIRTVFHLEGKLNDGSTAKSSQHEYLFRVCKTAGCANNPCF